MGNNDCSRLVGSATSIRPAATSAHGAGHGVVAHVNAMLCSSRHAIRDLRRGRSTRSTVLAAMVGLASALSWAPLAAATFVVSSTLDVQDDRPGDGVCATTTATCTLRAAITEANALAGADVITLPAGTYTTTLVAAAENGNLGGDFDINSDITINGADSRTTIVQAATTAGVSTERVFHLRFVSPGTTVELSNMWIRHGRYIDGSQGAGLRVDVGAVVATLNNVSITDNHNGNSGGGIAISSATGSITTLNGCRVDANTTGGSGSSASSGAGILLDSATATLNLTNSRVSGNVISSNGSAQGAGISSIGVLNITSSTILNNAANAANGDSQGGGIYSGRGTMTVLDSTIRTNTATAATSGWSAQGGGIYGSQSTLVLDNSLVFGNAAALNAGIATTSSAMAATTTITNSTISNNTALSFGGGVGNNGIGPAAATTTISGSTISGNIVTGAAGAGGGLRNGSGTSALATMNVINSTISGNISARGAGSYNQGNNASISFNFVTIADNTATADGGGIFQGATGAIAMKNSIVADNAAVTGPDLSGVVTSGGYNHVEDVAGGTFTLAAGDVVGADPQLAALVNNGGTTKTHRPAASSPVINAIPFGISDCANIVDTSQNGMARPQQVGCEKGSVEVDTNVIFQHGFDPADETGIHLASATDGGGM